MRQDSKLAVELLHAACLPLASHRICIWSEDRTPWRIRGLHDLGCLLLYCLTPSTASNAPLCIVVGEPDLPQPDGEATYNPGVLWFAEDLELVADTGSIN